MAFETSVSRKSHAAAAFPWRGLAMAALALAVAALNAMSAAPALATRPVAAIPPSVIGMGPGSVP